MHSHASAGKRPNSKGFYLLNRKYIHLPMHSLLVMHTMEGRVECVEKMKWGIG